MLLYALVGGRRCVRVSRNLDDQQICGRVLDAKFTERFSDLCAPKVTSSAASKAMDNIEDLRLKRKNRRKKKNCKV
jgi:hypothetical protein